jgi:uncharacterized metal-binding protein YceD (DUF177 family)
MSTEPRPEFSRPLPLGRVGPEGRREVLEAGPAEREALARRFGLVSVDSFRAELVLRPEPDGAVRAEGRMQAEVVQTCVVTLDPVPQRVEEQVALRFLPPGREADEGPEEIDEVETAQGGTADLGEALAEQLALALDPYPRAPGATLPEEATDTSANPLAALGRLRDRH